MYTLRLLKFRPLFTCHRDGLSQIDGNLKNTTFNGNPVLNNIFSTYSNLSNYMSFQLSRSNLGITDGGIFTLGEVPSNFSGVLEQPVVPVISQTTRWIGVGDGMIVNGETYIGNGIL